MEWSQALHAGWLACNLSRAPLRKLIVASGHAMLGVSLGPVTGKLAAQLACGEPADLDVSSLKISRFG
jgi:glycine/D-amino acid oxidase-like deaminating enzyme